MWSTILYFWNLLKRIGRFLFPVLGKARGLWTPLLWILHFLLLIAVLVGLYWLNQFFLLIPPEWVPVRFPFLRNSWLPVFVLILYLMAWVAWWLWRLLGSGEEVEYFPDIEEAWAEAVYALAKQGIRLPDVPVFLVLGHPAEGEEILFAASRLNLFSAPLAPGSPVRVYGNRDVVFVTCPQASLSDTLADLLEQQDVPEPNTSVPVIPSGGSPDIDKTIPPVRGKTRAIQMILRKAEQEGRTLNDQEKALLAQLTGGPGNVISEQPEGPPRAPILRADLPQVAYITERLKYLCRLIVRDRHPFCPINGILLVIPFAATDRDEEANASGWLYQKDLAAIRSIFQQHCPLFALVSDLERTPGFVEFLSQFEAEERRRRMGQRFPLVPDIKPGPQWAEEMAALIDSAVSWICHAVFPSWVYGLFRLEGPEEDLSGVIHQNAQLFWLMSEMQSRKHRLSQILSQAIITPGWMGEEDRPVLFGGCYLAATGKDRSTQGFVPGVFSRLLEQQSAVCWTREALIEDANYHRYTQMGYLFLLTLIGLWILGLLLWWLL
jgi:hypothetical protein